MSDWLPYESSWDEEKLLQRIEDGENTYQDFKQTINEYYKIARSVVSFANQKGGSLFIGVDDKGGICGTQPRSEYFKLVDILESFCMPLPDVHCYVYDVEGREVLEIDVLEGHKKPYASRDKAGKWKIYLRVGDQCKKIGDAKN
ncbi:MAG: ATP-binding protein [Bacteroidetes bacterium]|nr:ATP-binding protein [Bacteroidota bacterium]